MNDRFLNQLVEARLDAALQSTAEGFSLLVRARRPSTWDTLQVRAVEGPMARETLLLGGDGERPQEALIAAAADFGSPATTLTGVVRAPELRWVCFMADARAYPAAPWLRLAGAFASARAEQSGAGPMLIICLDSLTAPTLCRLLDDGDFVGPAEATVFARSRRSGAGLLGEAADAAAIEAARGDLDLLEQLIELPEQLRFDPFDWAAGQPTSHDPAPLLWRGREEACPTWLVRHDPGRLRRRIWRGHVGVLLPWLVEGLAEFMLRHGARLPDRIAGRDGETIEANDYEWGEIASLLKQRAPLLVPAAHALRLARNDLAHGRALALARAATLQAQAQQLINWH